MPVMMGRYAFLAKFLKEVTSIFPEKNLFLGGDEVSGTCWSGSPTVKAWMDAHNMNSTGLGRYFWQQLTAQVLPGLNRAWIHVCFSCPRWHLRITVDIRNRVFMPALALETDGGTNSSIVQQRHSRFWLTC